MGSSYVEYKRFGFWARDALLESWLTTLLDEMDMLLAKEQWQQSLMEHWRIQCKIDGGCMDVGLDEFVTNDERKSFLLSIAGNVSSHSDPLVHRTGDLFIDLIEGKAEDHRCESRRLF